MVTVAAAAIAGAAQHALKRMSRVVVVGEYPIIELRIHVAIGSQTDAVLLIKRHQSSHLYKNEI